MQWMARLTGPVCMYLMQLWMETPCKFQDFLSQCGVILKLPTDSVIFIAKWRKANLVEV